MLKWLISQLFSKSLAFNSLAMPHEHEQAPQGWLTMYSREVDGVRGGHGEISIVMPFSWK